MTMGQPCPVSPAYYPSGLDWELVEYLDNPPLYFLNWNCLMGSGHLSIVSMPWGWRILYRHEVGAIQEFYSCGYGGLIYTIPYIQCIKNIILISGLSIVQGFISTLTRPKRRRKIGSRLSMQLWQQRKWKPLMKCKKLLLPRPKTSQWEFKNWCLSKYLIFYHITIMHWITLGYCVTIFIHALSS